jgi:hypothetical protein
VPDVDQIHASPKNINSMKTMKSLMAIVAFLAVGLLLKAGNGNEVELNGTSCTFEELQTQFGSNIVLEEGLTLEMLQGSTMIMLGGPCDAFPDFELCGIARAQASAAARDFARECCCEVIYGWECCDPGTGSAVSYLAIMSPPQNCR